MKKTTDSVSAPDFIAPHIAGLPRSGIRDFFELVSTRKNVISLGIGEPDFVTPWHIREAAIFALDNGATTYTANSGLAELRQAVARYVASRCDAEYDWRDEVLITVGVSEALDLAVRATVSPGDEVIYHEPSFVAYAPLVSMAHGVPVPVVTRPENGFRLSARDIEAACTDRTRVLLLNFPTNPTGGVLDRGTVAEIADLARRRNLVVISDEVYLELTYAGEMVSLASQPGLRSRLILLNGLSKAWAMTGFRVGFACAPAAITEAMMKIHQYGMMCAPILSQKAAMEALDNGERDIENMRESYRLRRNLICGELNRMGLDCHVPQGAFYVFPSIRSTGMSSRDFSVGLLETENVACVPGTAFGACGEGFIRCSYATGVDQIKEAMFRMQRFVANQRKV